jgi:1,4-alpha-glucan branching enzyme
MSIRNGGWEITLSLTPGKYAYRFLIDSGKQVLDPASKFTESDGYGGENSIFFVEQ